MDENNLEETSTNEEQSSLSNSSKCYTKPKPSIQEHYYTPPPTPPPSPRPRSNRSNRRSFPSLTTNLSNSPFKSPSSSQLSIFPIPTEEVQERKRTDLECTVLLPENIHQTDSKENNNTAVSSSEKNDKKESPPTNSDSTPSKCFNSNDFRRFTFQTARSIIFRSKNLYSIALLGNCIAACYLLYQKKSSISNLPLFWRKLLAKLLFQPTFLPLVI